MFSAVLGFIQEYRAERAIESLRDMLRATASVLRDGAETTIDATEIVPGDVIALEAGDRIPADARLFEVASLTLDEAALTGESMPVEKSTEAVRVEAQIGDRTDMAHTGGIVTYGRARAVVTETGMNTELGKIAKEVAAVKTEPTPLERRTSEIGRWLGIGALVICAVIMLLSLVRAYEDGTLTMDEAVLMAMFAISLAVAAVPEALAAIVTGALAIGMREMAKRHALIRKMPAVETLGCTTVICTDKTGTLTKAEMTVRRLYSGGAYVDVSGAGYEPQGEITPHVESPALAVLLRAGALCNDSELYEQESRWSIKGDSTEAALLVLAAKAGLDYRKLRVAEPRITEVPFSSERKMMTVVVGRGSALVAYSKGAPEIVLRRCATIMDPDGTIRQLTEADRAAISAANAEMASSALRVLGLAICGHAKDLRGPGGRTHVPGARRNDGPAEAGGYRGGAHMPGGAYAAGDDNGRPQADRDGRGPRDGHL